MKKFLLLTALIALAPALARAEYPERPVAMVVPFPAGGPTDKAARTIADALSESFRKPFVVENRPGAQGAIAARAVAGAAPDGYTLLFGVSSMIALSFLQNPAPLDPKKDLAPVATIGRFPFALYVTAAVPAKTVGEFVTYARANPDKLFYASNAPSEALAASQFMKATGVRMVRVPYKGAAQAMPDLLTGRVQVGIGPISAPLPYVKDGKLRILAVLLRERTLAAPDVPTLAEGGIPDVPVPTWQAVFAPAGTPESVVTRLSQAVNDVLRSAKTRASLERLPLHVEGSTPQELAATIDRDTSLWAAFTRENDLVAK